MSTIQRITSSYKVDTSFPFQDLPRDYQDYLEIASINEFGILLSAGLLFNNKSIMVKCVIDGVEAFEVNLEIINEMYPNNNSTSGVQLPMFFDDSRDLLVFRPAQPIMFKSHIKFYAKASSNSSSRGFESGLIEYTKE